MILPVQHVTLRMEFSSGKYRNDKAIEARLKSRLRQRMRSSSPTSDQCCWMAYAARCRRYTARQERRAGTPAPVLFRGKLEGLAYPTRKRDRPSIVVALSVNS